MRIRIGKKRNENNAWVPGFRFLAEYGFARLDTPILGILIRKEYDIPVLRIEYVRESHRNQGEVYFKKAIEFHFVRLKIFTKFINMNIFNPRNAPPGPWMWACNGKVYTLDKNGNPRISSVMDTYSEASDSD